MLTKIDFERYRAFSGKQSLRLAPLTVIFGKNNTGKSAVLKLPVLVSNAIRCETEDVFTKNDNSGILLCDEYRDVVYGKGNHAVGLTLTDEFGENTARITFIAENQAGVSHSKIEELVVKSNQFELKVTSDDDGILRVSETNEALHFYGLTPRNEEYKTQVKNILQHLDMLIDYIGPVRWHPKRYFSQNEFVSGKLGQDGKNAYAYLLKDSQNAIHPLLDNVSKWYEKNFDGWKVKVGNSRAPVFSIEMVNDDLPNNNICDAGFGIQQSMPIVVAAYKSYEKPTLVIVEEPECHLNPAAHASMGELLAMAAVSDRKKRFLIETHSHSFMIRLRTLIAKGILQREDVALYYVDYKSANNSSSLMEVGIKDNGEVVNWPENMFKETLNEALALRDAQMGG